ncbi:MULTISPECIES: DMT family transporter [unclassified Legionella]|uniref:DMT family transporter n=1 Tax=unclassified Legionella TaxID=2622702 RepID=UPI001F5F522A|nr:MULTISPECIES: DMT family transporter [unclassified Legionella]MDI9818815.1 DMT family transporter [Legionella sp. PL877]
MPYKNYGALYAALSGLFFGLIGYFGVSVMNAGISVYTMLFWRFFISGLFMVFLLLPRFRGSQPYFSSKETIKVVFDGAAFYGTCSILYFIATKYIGSGLAMVIFFTYPAIVMLINFIFYKQKVNNYYYLALVIIFIGMAGLVNGSEFHFNFMGIGLSLLASLLYALYIISSKNSPVPALLSTLLVSIGAMLICLFAALAEHSFLVPLDYHVWFNILGIGIICTALPIVLLLNGLKHISAVQASILSVLEPVFVVIFGILLLGEKINFIQAAGVATLLTGALLALLTQKQQ